MISTQLENSLSRSRIEALAQARHEPAWMLSRRLEAREAAHELELPSSRYTQVRGLNLAELQPVGLDLEATPVDAVGAKRALPLCDSQDQTDGLLIHLNGRLVHSELQAELAHQGVLFMDFAAALAEHPELIERYLLRESPELSDKITALQRALTGGGVLLYVPPNVEVQRPLKAINLLTEENIGLFQQVLIIAEPGSRVSYVEELGSLDRQLETPSAYAGDTRVYVGQAARVDVAGVQNWAPQIFNFSRRQGRLERDGRLRWTFGWLGGRLTLSQVESRFEGPGTQVEDVQIFFADGRQHFDLVSNLIHSQPHTQGKVTVKGVLKDKAKAVFWGRIRIDPEAQQANSFQSERSLMLNEGPRSVAIPSLEIEANDVRCTHAASSSQLDQEQIFYLMTRGLNENQAKKAIVDGFFEPTVRQIPLASAQEQIRALVDRKWQNLPAEV
ncbi:MAG TPA: Fe-S cluster assembly protein SufD [Candidatus Fraserbacteria bacterium]|nr:Fe-S cluster assembly protein SufD [Candidatus Fraserbacteria bacterium]